VVGHDAAGGVSTVALDGGAEVTIPHHPDLAVGSAVALAVEAEEVLVATAPPVGLSARNAMAGRVEALIPAAGSVFVRVGGWLARLTPAAVAELGLAPGREVWLVVKTHSWRVVEG
jgi:molybdate transport system ATP-binding protein